MKFFDGLREDIDAIMKRDPAARSRLAVLFLYSGLHTMLFYRLSHAAWVNRLYFVGRLISHIGRMLTGIEIHPGARIGRRLFIDHGMGCVIGETAEIGDDVTLYHGVTLDGALLKKEKRHPTLEDGVIVGSGAQVLGPLTVGKDARIGANAVVLRDIPPRVTVVGIPAKQVLQRPPEAKHKFRAYGTPQGSILDPAAEVLDRLLGEVESLRKRIEAVEWERDGNYPAPAPEPLPQTAGEVM